MRDAIRTAALALLVTATAAQAQPTAPAPALEVLHDTGRSIPMAPYLSYLVAAESQASVMPDLSFPIETALRPGVLPAEEVQVFEPRWLVQPIFIVGSDARSLRWLEHNRARLRAMHAWGVVIQARNEQAFKVVQRAADGLQVGPSTGTWLDERLQGAGAGVYPLLIQANGRARQIVLSPDLAGGNP